jgi:hypothetical protein
VLKASWSVAEPNAGRRHDVSARPEGSGFKRLDVTVVVPEIALVGRFDFKFEVLEDPDTGAWYGEESGLPGSALVAIEKAGTVRSTRETVAALEKVAAVARRVLEQISSGAAEELDSRLSAMASEIVGTLPRPTAGGLAIDVARARSGSASPPASWQRTNDGVLLQVGDRDDPTGWTENWMSVEDLLVADTPGSRVAVERLALTAHRGPLASSAYAEARGAAIQSLAKLAPDLMPSVGSTIDWDPTGMWRMNTAWRAGSRRAAADCLGLLLLSRRAFAELGEVFPEEGHLAWYAQEAVAADYISAEQAVVLTGPDLSAAREVIRVIWDFEADPAFADEREIDWSADWPDDTPAQESSPGRRRGPRGEA